MTESTTSPEKTRRRLSDATLAIYAAITLLGVIAAASWEGLFADEKELFVIIVGTAVTLAVGHAWSAVAAHRLVYGTKLTSSERRLELRGMAVTLAVGGAATATFGISALVSDNLDQEVQLTLLVLVAVLFFVGLVGSRRRRDAWPRAIGWGLIDASIGIAIFELKVLVGS
ncbi:MAG: hypothetical protein FJW80_04980 [Actinobacteria bacterium]|nr:hypothetical protein [Actinomycetota bacterium]